MAPNRNEVSHSPSWRDSSTRCKILVIDDDSVFVEEIKESIAELGYEYETTSGALEGLRKITDDPEIGIVLCDVRLPDMAGTELVSELTIRIPENRPLIIILMSGFADMEMAITALRLGVNDLLHKPIKTADLARALRQGLSLWKTLQNAKQSEAMILPQERQGTGVEAPLSLPTSGHQAGQAFAAAATHPGKGFNPKSPLDLVEFLCLFKRERDRVNLNPMLGDPVWDITLELLRAKISGEVMPVSSASTASNAPTSTSLRWIRKMAQSGMVRRWHDPDDKRRDLVELSDKYTDDLISFFDLFISKWDEKTYHRD